MEERPHTVQGTILSKSTYGESYLMLKLFSPEYGLIHILQRQPKNKTVPSPDLFDQVEVLIDYGKNNGPGFLKDFSTGHQASALAVRYQNFNHACQFGKLLCDNLLHFSDFESTYALLFNALQAWTVTSRPEAVHFKTLYLLARDQGYPVKEQWWYSMHAEDQKLVAEIIRTPADELLTTIQTTDRLLKSLRFWLAVHTDFVVHDPSR